MPNKKRSWLSIPASVFTITLLLMYAMVCLVPFVPAGILWIFNIPGLIFPFLFFALIIFTIIYFIIRSKWKWWCLIILILGFQQIFAVFPFHFSHTWTNEKSGSNIRILSWNVNSWDIANFTSKNGNTFHVPMMNFIKIQNADILCFQEFFECIDPKIVPSYIEPFKEIGYPYHYFAPYSYTVSGKFQTGLVLFSKWPITDTAFFKSVSAGHSEGFTYTDIQINSKKIRIFNTHLESVGFNSDDYRSVGKVKGSRTIIRKLINSYKVRNIQATELSSQIRKSSYPAIVCGDIDDVPNSSAYFSVRGNLQDAFIQKGTWPGATFRFISPTLRIDYIFAQNDFKINQFITKKVLFSDHLPLITDMQFKN